MLRFGRSSRAARPRRASGVIGGGGGGGGGAALMEPVATSMVFSTTQGSQTAALPAEATDGRWVIFIYGTQGTNSIGGPPTGYTTIAEAQRVGAYYKQISGVETTVPAIGASNGYPFHSFIVYENEPTITQAYAGIFTTFTAYPQNIAVGTAKTFDRKDAVDATSTVWGLGVMTNDDTATPDASTTRVEQVLTTFGPDHGSALFRQDGAGADIDMGYTCNSAVAGISFVVSPT